MTVTIKTEQTSFEYKVNSLKDDVLKYKVRNKELEKTIEEM